MRSYCAASSAAPAYASGSLPRLRLGLDLLGVSELDELSARPWFARYAFAPAEMAQAGTLGSDRRREYLAGRFAAKEAVLKVLGIGLFRGVRPADISVLSAGSGEPRVVLTGPARDAGQAAGLAGVTVSIAHKGSAVAAIACGWVSGREAGGVPPFPDEGHGLDQPDNRIAFYQSMERFHATHIGAAAPAVRDMSCHP